VAEKAAQSIDSTGRPKRSVSLRRFRYLLKAYTEILGNLGKWLATVVTLSLLAIVTYRTFHDSSVQIGTIVVPKDFEDRGYTSRTVGERLRFEIEHIVRKTQTIARKGNLLSPATPRCRISRYPKLASPSTRS
jgi:hypothetical protein